MVRKSRSPAALIVSWEATDSGTNNQPPNVCLLAPADGVPERAVIEDPDKSQMVFSFEQVEITGYTLTVSEGRQMPIGCASGPKEQCSKEIAVDAGQTTLATIRRTPPGTGCEISLFGLDDLPEDRPEAPWADPPSDPPN
jgi:hypothetical protein